MRGREGRAWRRGEGIRENGRGGGEGRDVCAYNIICMHLYMCVYACSSLSVTHHVSRSGFSRSVQDGQVAVQVCNI